MDLREAILTIFNNVKGVTQAGIAREARVQRPQLNTYLRQNVSLPEESRARLAKSVLAEVDKLGIKDGRDYRSELATPISVLIQSTEYSEAETKSAKLGPDLPPAPSSPAYYERKADKALNAQLQAYPQLFVNILGGPKTGKSSILRETQNKLPADKYLIVELDCSDYSRARDDGQTPKKTNLFQWFTTQCLNAKQVKWAKDIPNQVEGIAEFHSWIVYNIIHPAGLRNCIFLVDNVDALYQPNESDGKKGASDLITFLTALFQVSHNSRDVTALERCKFLLAYDEGHKVFRQVGVHDSMLKIKSSYITLENFSQIPVRTLMERSGVQESVIDEAAETAWRELKGHPFLTQVYINALRQSLDHTKELGTAVRELCRCLRGRWEPAILDQVGDYLKKNAGSSSPGIPIADPTKYAFVADTGLFTLEYFANQGTDFELKVTTEWLKRKLAKYWEPSSHAQG